MKNYKDIENSLLSKFDINDGAPITSFEALKKRIKEEISYLIDNDFSALMNLLYRIDVDERIVKEQLEQAGISDAAAVITDLIIEREIEKLESRKKMKENDSFEESDGEYEKW